jgi:hypothetical protein
MMDKPPMGFAEAGAIADANNQKVLATVTAPVMNRLLTEHETALRAFWIMLDAAPREVKSGGVAAIFLYGYMIGLASRKDGGGTHG